MPKFKVSEALHPSNVPEDGGMVVEWRATVYCAACRRTDVVEGDSEALSLESFTSLARWRFVAKGWLTGLEAARTNQGRTLCPNCR